MKVKKCLNKLKFSIRGDTFKDTFFQCFSPTQQNYPYNYPHNL